jgi:hypothetical protein
MSKALIWMMTIIGFFLLLIGILSTKFLIMGLLLIAAAFYIGLGPDGILRADQVIDTWSALIENAQGKGADVLKDTEDFINKSKAPDIAMVRREMAPSLMDGMIGKNREFLIVTEQTFRLQPYQIYINARDYGVNLDVSWNLTYKPSFWQSVAALLPYVNVIPRTFSDLDLFDKQDLTVYVTNAHHCMQKAVDKLMLDLKQDPNRLERKSKGFLGIS